MIFTKQANSPFIVLAKAARESEGFALAVIGVATDTFSALNTSQLPPREAAIITGALGAAWTADTISTHYAFAAAPNHMESGFIFHNSRSVPKIMGAWAAVDVAAVVASY